MRLFNFVLAITFLVLASLQVRTDEPVRWILIFGSMAIVSILSMFEFFYRPLLLLLISLFMAYGVYLWSTRGATDWFVVNGIAGLTGCVALLVFQVFRSYRRH